MPCYHLILAGRGPVNSAGKRPLVFGENVARCNETLYVPCGRCIGCRLEFSRQWAVRMMHEAKMHDDNMFLTLTYDEENCPSDYSLSKDVFQRFMKRYRKLCGAGIRFYACGEYGEKYLRPHYHACIFGHDFADKQPFTVSSGKPVYCSESLAKLWPFGRAYIAEFSFETAAYVARYVTKKVSGAPAEEVYQRVSDTTGEIWQVEPEFSLMSRRPGIGKAWFERYSSDVYPHDRVINDGFPMKPPRFYDYLYEMEKPDEFDLIKRKRVLDNLDRNEQNMKRGRLQQREEFARCKFKTFKSRGDV